MFAEKIVTNLVSIAIKNPRASATAILLLVVGFLGYSVYFLFDRSDTKDLAANEKLYAEIRELKVSVTHLQKNNDSLVGEVGRVEANGLRREIALKDTAALVLKAFNVQIVAEKAAMAQELNRLQRIANSSRIESEKLKNKSHESN